MSEDAPGRLRRFIQRVDKDPRLVKLLRLGRSRLPGDDKYGDPLSLTGDQAPAVLGRRLSAATAERPGALREVGMSALQVWQGLSEAQGRGRGDRELTIVFTDLAEFSSWALDAGDTRRSCCCARSAPRSSPRSAGAAARSSSASATG